MSPLPKLLLSPAPLRRVPADGTEAEVRAAAAPLERFLKTATPDEIRGQPAALLDALAKAYLRTKADGAARPLYELLPRFLIHKPYRAPLMALVTETLVLGEEDFTCATSFIRRVRAMKLATLCADYLRCAYVKEQDVETAVNDSLSDVVKEGLRDPHWAVRHAAAETAATFVSMRPRRGDEETFDFLLAETMSDNIFNDREEHVLSALEINMAAREDDLCPQDLKALRHAAVMTPCPQTAAQLRELVKILDSHAPQARRPPDLRLIAQIPKAGEAGPRSPAPTPP